MIKELKENTNNTQVSEELWSAVCSGNTTYVNDYFAKNPEKINDTYFRFNQKHSLLMGAFRNRQWRTIEVLLYWGAKVLDSEVRELQNSYEYKLINRMLDTSELP